MKIFSRCLVVGFLAVTVVFFASWSGLPKPPDVKVALGTEPMKELVLQPSYRAVPVLNEASTGCLFCHGFSYENLREKTANFVYNGEKLQPHFYLDMTKRNPHDTTKEIECLVCHAEHSLPSPVGQTKKPTLDYCVNCHHTGDIIACADCHGRTP